MLGRPGALAVALASVIAAAPAPALAQPKSPNRPPQDIANDLVKQAITKSQQGDHLGAIKLYLDAYSLIPQHTLLSNVGAEYQAAGKLVEALKYFCMYLEKDPTGTNATYATSNAKVLQIELGNKDVDDRNVCKPPKKDPDPPPDEPIVVPDVKPPPVGGPQGEEASGGGTLKIAGVAVGVLGLAGVAAGSYYGLKALDRGNFFSNHDPSQPWPDNLKELDEEGKRWERLQIGLTIAGGALTVTGVVLFIVGATRPSGPEQQVMFRPLVTRDGFGMAFGRDF